MLPNLYGTAVRAYACMRTCGAVFARPLSLVVCCSPLSNDWQSDGVVGGMMADMATFGGTMAG